MRSLILVDNGSRRPNATRSLRRIAAALGERLARPVHPVSLQHSADLSAAELDGRPADTLEPFLAARAAQGERAWLAVPLFFGPSRGLTRFIPDTVAAVVERVGPLDVRVAEVLCPLPAGEPRLVDILADNVAAARKALATPPNAVVVVDHGSPLPAVTQVRRWLAAALSQRLGPRPALIEAVMERRAGRDYDFNGNLLEEVLEGLVAAAAAVAAAGQQPGPVSVILAMQFISPGRHAGEGGDIEQICAAVQARHPMLAPVYTPLVGDHPMLIDILESRVRKALIGI